MEPLPPDDGGGFLTLCDETPEAALADVKDAVEAWIEEARTLGRSVPSSSRRHTAA